jgi:tetratricopeptide (TPR) repeat protein
MGDEMATTKCTGMTLAVMATLMLAISGAGCQQAGSPTPTSQPLAGSLRGGPARRPIDPDYSVFAGAARTAETIVDPLQRCLAYPDPPGSHWNKQTTAAYCAFHLGPSIDPAAVRALLAVHKAAEVDSRFAAMLTAETDGRGEREQIRRAYLRLGLDKTDPSKRAMVDAWLRQSPHSPYARTASGLLFLAEGLAARGTGYFNTVTPAQALVMGKAFQRARVDFRQAIKLEPRLLAAYVGLFNVESVGGDRDDARAIAKAALQVDPLSFRMRQVLLLFTLPQWGGTEAERASQIQEARALSGRNPLLNLLPGEAAARLVEQSTTGPVRDPAMAAIDTGAMVADLDYLARSASHSGDQSLAVVLYSEQLRFDPTNADAVRWRGEAMLARGRSAWALQAAADAVERYPANESMLLSAAVIYGVANDPRRAIVIYESLLDRDPKNENAMLALGYVYTEEDDQPDKATRLSDRLIALYPDKPGGWFIRARVQTGHQLPGRYQTVDFYLKRWGDDPAQAAWADMIREWLQGHPR